MEKGLYLLYMAPTDSSSGSWDVLVRQPRKRPRQSTTVRDIAPRSSPFWSEYDDTNALSLVATHQHSGIPFSAKWGFNGGAIDLSAGKFPQAKEDADTFLMGDAFDKRLLSTSMRFMSVSQLSTTINTGYGCKRCLPALAKGGLMSKGDKHPQDCTKPG